MRSRMTGPPERACDWEPLERALPEAWLDGWMFMFYVSHPAGGEDLRAYKHQITRRYLHLRLEDGHVAAYRFLGHDSYRAAKLVEEVEDAYATIEPLGFTRAMEPVERAACPCERASPGEDLSGLFDDP
ncbi:hypothetical protein Q5424_18445 [Conexibacter sp. JD483]|uniref:hypothetical protein n=1 Tax=unclassified Conexibacter TaxID=2627773 RepID=UPI002726B260|nr:MULTISPECIES: hypothetical protein [unclassified Conexibacter]MDO8186698.1 hypothetical protein [Conexibacter sp. CPCC 205706]MDO8200418.1 hypothetical protein [Conexibacter sp. CPCC 205762]MDR9371082.1 hypothetical protein [Conexibacter sp. JD483]